jgi:hypothetical protein
VWIHAASRTEVLDTACVIEEHGITHSVWQDEGGAYGGQFSPYPATWSCRQMRTADAALGDQWGACRNGAQGVLRYVCGIGAKTCPRTVVRLARTAGGADNCRVRALATPWKWELCHAFELDRHHNQFAGADR